MTALALPPARLPRIAVLGAGHVGPVIARVAIEAGYHVSIAASGDPEEIELIAQVLAPGAEPRRAADAVEEAGIVVLAIPLHKFKTLNHIGYHELEDERRPGGSPERRALGVAGDDPAAVDVVAELIERIGYDAVRFDRLSAGRLLEPGGPVFGASLHRTEFELAVRAEAA